MDVFRGKVGFIDGVQMMWNWGFPLFRLECQQLFWSGRRREGEEESGGYLKFQGTFNLYIVKFKAWRGKTSMTNKYDPR